MGQALKQGIPQVMPFLNFKDTLYRGLPLLAIDILSYFL